MAENPRGPRDLIANQQTIAHLRSYAERSQTTAHLKAAMPTAKSEPARPVSAPASPPVADKK